MRRFWFHISVFLVLAAFQFSFVNVAAGSRAFTPNILLITVIAWMLRKDFSWVWWRAIALGVTYDLVSVGPFGISALLLLWFAYATSFLSRRLLVEQRSGSGFLTAALLTGAFSVAYAALEYALVFSGDVFFASGWSEAFTNGAMLAIINFATFFVFARLIRRFDRFLFSDGTGGFGSLSM